MNFRTINDLNLVIYNNLHLIPSDIDLIVGIPRSGMLAASILALYLNFPLTDLYSLMKENIYQSGRTKVKKSWINTIQEAKKILIVEDSSSTGKSLEDAKALLEDFRFKHKVVYLTIFVTKKTVEYTDIYFEIVPVPRMFEWNYLHHKRVDRLCFDIDGVLCRDPLPEENDDGKKYVEFIRNAEAKVVPTCKIGYLITSRLEKYRKDTEYWLAKNNIKYDKLIMMPYASKEERLKYGNHGIYKGKKYKELGQTSLFVESEAKQAKEIASISGKAVFCIENHRLYDESSLTKKKELIKSKLKDICPRRIKEIVKKLQRKII